MKKVKLTVGNGVIAAVARKSGTLNRKCAHAVLKGSDARGGKSAVSYYLLRRVQENQACECAER